MLVLQLNYFSASCVFIVSINTVGDIISTLEGVQYTGGVS